MKPKLISVADLCTMLGIGRTKAYELLRTDLRSVRIGQRRLIVVASVKKLMKQSSEGGKI